VIPTGSMAPTLMGAHMRFRCPDCGYRFEVNFSTGSSNDVSIPRSTGAKVFSTFCPNCGYQLPRDNPQDPDNDGTDVPVRYGDRILVLKYLYLFQPPRRWDVVVFKAPYWPAENDYSQNYIKRLIGRPEETIMVLDGDIYVGHRDESWEPLEREIQIADDAEKKAERIEVETRDGAEKIRARQAKEQAQERKFIPQCRLAEKFIVQAKPSRAQDALWRIVYDDDFYPRGLDRSDANNPAPWAQPWKQMPGQSGWDVQNGADGKTAQREFRFSNLTGESTLRFDAEIEGRKNALTDWLAYDAIDSQTPSGDANVSDVKLDFYYQRVQGDGTLKLELTKLGHRFEARIDDNSASLLMDGKPIGEPASIGKQSTPRHVQFMNVDYRASLLIDEREVLATTPQQYHPDIPVLLRAYNNGQRLEKAGVRITGQQQECVLSHIGLWRDVYYLNRNGNRQLNGRTTNDPLWASPADFPKNLMRLGPGEYFVMGDNSQVSLDARFWDDPIDLPHENLHVRSGVVPARFMLGKAFFVYWPAGFRPFEAAPALSPNFGDMRFIH
jgi:signal peptidase I